jgi:hypothetical protein
LHLMAAVLKRRGGTAAPVSEDDVLRAIEKLGVLGGGWSVHQVRSDRYRPRRHPAHFDPSFLKLISIR